MFVKCMSAQDQDSLMKRVLHWGKQILRGYTNQYELYVALQQLFQDMEEYWKGFIKVGKTTNVTVR